MKNVQFKYKFIPSILDYMLILDNNFDKLDKQNNPSAPDDRTKGKIAKFSRYYYVLINESTLVELFGPNDLMKKLNIPLQGVYLKTPFKTNFELNVEKDYKFLLYLLYIFLKQHEHRFKYDVNRHVLASSYLDYLLSLSIFPPNRISELSSSFLSYIIRDQNDQPISQDRITYLGNGLFKINRHPNLSFESFTIVGSSEVISIKWELSKDYLIIGFLFDPKRVLTIDNLSNIGYFNNVKIKGTTVPELTRFMLSTYAMMKIDKSDVSQMLQNMYFLHVYNHHPVVNMLFYLLSSEDAIITQSFQVPAIDGDAEEGFGSLIMTKSPKFPVRDLLSNNMQLRNALINAFSTVLSNKYLNDYKIILEQESRNQESNNNEELFKAIPLYFFNNSTVGMLLSSKLISYHELFKQEKLTEYKRIQFVSVTPDPLFYSLGITTDIKTHTIEIIGGPEFDDSLSYAAGGPRFYSYKVIMGDLKQDIFIKYYNIAPKYRNQ